MEQDSKQRISLYQQLIREEDINTAKIYVNIPTFSDGPIRNIQIEFARDKMGMLIRVIGHKDLTITKFEIKKTDNELLEEISKKLDNMTSHLNKVYPREISPIGDEIIDKCDRHWMYNSFNCPECGTGKFPEPLKQNGG